MPSNNVSLIRLNIRLPEATHAKLRQVAATKAVPMSALIRMLVVEWIEGDTALPTPPRP